MESHGKAGLIQVSQATAALLEDAGKGQWLTKRKDQVEAKGKGTMETYWINLSNKVENPRVSTRALEDPSTAQPRDVNAQRQRLINWNVDLLSRLLTNIVTQRHHSPTHQLSGEESKSVFAGMQEHSKAISTPRDEVTEVIVLPRSSSKGSIEESNESVLDPVVADQLKDLVAEISSLYHNNHFHSFEHACNVTMSARKFLCRVVKPDAGGSLETIDGYTFGITNDPLGKLLALML